MLECDECPGELFVANLGGSSLSLAKTSEIGGSRLFVCVAGMWWMWLVWLRPLGPCCACRVCGNSPGRKPVNV